MGKNGNSKTFELALSGISCAVAAGALALGILSDYLVATGYLIGVTALMVPLSKQFFKGGFLAYLGTLILAVVLGAAVQFWKIVPFAMFFGLHPLANALQTRYKVNRWLALFIKMIWFDCTLIAAYHLVYGGLLGGTLFPEDVYKVINDYIYLFIFTVGSVICFIYDYLIFKLQIGINFTVQRIIKK
ncbi:MAG: hypothetical protein K2N30_03445 [Clostridia bacterium]|nr:hypothetical protein [Clostridia bacterium]